MDITNGVLEGTDMGDHCEPQVEHPLQSSSEVKLSSDLVQDPLQPQQKQFLFEERVQFLGTRFLLGKGFEESVQKTMGHLLHETIMSSTKNSTTDEQSFALNDLPTILFRIPINAEGEIELIFDSKTNETKLEQICKMTSAVNNEEDLVFADKNLKEDFETVLQSLKSSSIRIPTNRLFFYRGPLNSPTERCIALTTATVPPSAKTDNSSGNPAIHRHQQCFVLYTESPAKTIEILGHFRQLYGLNRQTSQITSGQVTQSPPSSVGVGSKMNEFKVVMVVDLEISEEVSEGRWQTCPREKDSFKLRTNLEKKICINLYQDLSHYNYPVIKVERCFGMLLSPGRNLNPNDMVPIGLKSMTCSNVLYSLAPVSQYQVTGMWIPNELNFDVLNGETPRDTRVFFSIAIDLIVANIEEPVRFIMEAKAKIVTPVASLAATATEKFWNFTSKTSKQHQEQFSLIIRQLASPKLAYEVTSCLSTAQIAHQQQRLSMQLKSTGSPDSKSNGSSDDLDRPTIAESDEDEPLQSGTGIVSKECSEATLLSWREVLEKWRQEDLNVRPKQLASLVRKGIPEALRPEVWQLLAGSHRVESKWMSVYRNLVTKSSKYEAIIQRDIYRTFPAHEFFRDPGSLGQDSLFKICKAYSNHDEEIGYCQGLSFLVAALLLHMPEEQAFCVLMQIMNQEYGLRNLYKDALDELHCKFYQLERLLDDQMPELSGHFIDLNVETHMYASQWFLTLYTSKFPLPVVFLILDLFLLDGMETLLKIALALLRMSKKNLLALDFEGIMKYFRITLPKMYRSDEAAKELIRKAVKMNVKKAAKYKKDYEQQREELLKRTNPVEYLQRENKRLMATTMRLEQENDDLASELLVTCNSKVRLKEELDRVEDKADTLNAELLSARKQLVDVEEEKQRLEEEVRRLKELCRSEVERAEAELRSNRSIIDEYKKICQNHQMKAENEKHKSEKQLGEAKEVVKDCEKCAKAICDLIDRSNNISRGKANGGEDSLGEEAQSNGSVRQKIDDLEMELIKTKMALAEAEDRNARMAGELHLSRGEVKMLQEEMANRANHKWFSKTYAMLKESASKVKQPTANSSNIDLPPNEVTLAPLAARRASGTAALSTQSLEPRLPKSLSRDG